jgi:LCP family protein required for cell wall assembly
MDARPGEGYITRTDSIMLMNISARKNDITILSIPRDVFIEVPGYAEAQRINTINVLGEMEAEGYGPTLVEASFDESFGVEVDHYVRLDFNAFVDLVDAVGGIDIDVSREIIDYEYPTADGGVITVHFMPGEQHMDGERALQYARTRHADDDYRRAERQQQVLDALVRKLAVPIYWPQAWQVVQNNTDTDLSTWEMFRLAPAVLLGWHGRTQRVMDREDLIGMQAGYWIPNYEQIQPWIDEHFD